MARLRACEAGSQPSCLCYFVYLPFLCVCHGKARSCYSPPVRQCSGTVEHRNQISMAVYCGQYQVKTAVQLMLQAKACPA